ncbi:MULTISPECIES: SLC13 family permease [Thalassospira]|uniref:Anion transporter n=2 Tax=Thalassospira TaxID=168934 RepID=A0A358HZZ1_9PROT|nr:MULTISPECIES: SLC13 family permease [Thalassospira]MBL4841128.1 anion transporter [Thalassospira sp.]MBR9781932.1 anion transporter [Rhodospirillales bacterium]KZD05936.1 anion transporter [Thalassospira xiamenensis]KZD07459.1 anion transporter [Thalassospira xiamenensis]MBR9816460.1 anion transporter [Rhodospirillales bacterium]
MDWLVVAVFGGVYIGMALGRWPGLAINRTGIALIGALVLLLSGAVDGDAALASIDFATLSVLLTLMVLSSQYAASGFFDWIGNRITHLDLTPRGLLAGVIAICGGLSAVMTNDVVVWAVTPILIQGVMARRLDPRPYVIAVACAANAGSAATLIGNPQNLMIAEFGQLDFTAFLLACGVPALIGLLIVYGVIGFGPMTRAAFDPVPNGSALDEGTAIILDRLMLIKAVAATLAVIAIFIFVEDRALWSLLIVAVLLLSRRLGTDQVLGRVDWHLLALFCGLFIVTGAMAGDDAIAAFFRDALSGLRIDNPAVLAPLSLVGSNTIGNVPLVMMLLSLGPDWTPELLHGLAVFSTLSGNFLIVGSVANIIAVEQARAAGITIGFGDYARIGIPVTLISLAFAWGWIMLFV